MLGGRNQEMGGYAPAQSAPQPSYQSRPAQSAPALQAEPPMDAFDDNNSILNCINTRLSIRREAFH